MINSRFTNLGLLSVTWILSLILPHFQSYPKILDYIFDFIVSFILFYSIGKTCSIFEAKNSNRTWFSILVVLLIFPLVYLLFEIGFKIPYKLWSRLGAGSMHLNGEIIPFGDLIHLTSAARCRLPVEVGTVVCDLWDRPLNQNPHIVELVRLFHFTNISVFGIASYSIFGLAVLLASHKIQVEGIWILLLLLSPPVILATDRGNELITISLIIVAMILIPNHSRILSTSGAGLLSFAAIFKLWPIVLISLLLVYGRKVINHRTKLILLSPIVYWTLHFKVAQKLIDATQTGSAFGNSFGLKIFWDSQLDNKQLFSLILIAAIFIIFFRFNMPDYPQVIEQLSKVRYGFFLFPILITYFVIWIIGNNFSYRAIVLLPAAMILCQKSLIGFAWSRKLLQIILFTLMTARLPIFVAISSAAASFFILFVFNQLRLHLMRKNDF